MVLFAYCWSWLLLMHYNYGFLVLTDNRKLIYKITKLCDSWCYMKMPIAMFHAPLSMFVHGAHSLCEASSEVQRRHFLDSRRFDLMWGEGIAKQIRGIVCMAPWKQTFFVWMNSAHARDLRLHSSQLHPWLLSSPHSLKTQTVTSCGSKGLGENRKIIKTWSNSMR